MTSVCMYHGVDLDGYCSAAIWKFMMERRSPNEETLLIPMNYGWSMPWDDLKDRDVTILDFCPQPWSEMERLLEIAKSVAWIDHHKSAIKTAEANNRSNIPGVRDTNHAACELAWNCYFFLSDTIPRGVFLLGDYDCWRHSDPDTMAFQYGMRVYDMDPGRTPSSMPMWRSIFRNDKTLINEIVSEGETVLEYQRRQDAAVAHGAFAVEFNGQKWIAINRGMIGSTFFDSLWTPKTMSIFSGMIAFHRTPKHWKVSLFSKTVDCSEIAIKHGGGGHVGAAGFQCEHDLPFQISGNDEMKELTALMHAEAKKARNINS